jgi:hypothetical protein
MICILASMFSIPSVDPAVARPFPKEGERGELVDHVGRECQPLVRRSGTSLFSGNRACHLWAYRKPRRRPQRRHDRRPQDQCFPTQIAAVLNQHAVLSGDIASFLMGLTL